MYPVLNSPQFQIFLALYSVSVTSVLTLLQWSVVSVHSSFICSVPQRNLKRWYGCMLRFYLMLYLCGFITLTQKHYSHKTVQKSKLKHKTVVNFTSTIAVTLCVSIIMVCTMYSPNHGSCICTVLQNAVLRVCLSIIILINLTPHGN